MRIVGYHTAVEQELHSFIGEQPDTDVCEVIMILLELRERLYGGLLEHLLHHRGGAAVADEHAVILCHRGIEPQSIAHHIRLWNRLERLCGTNEYIAADHHRMNIVRCHLHHLLVER